jgi:hypothetical protein
MLYSRRFKAHFIFYFRLSLWSIGVVILRDHPLRPSSATASAPESRLC